MALVLLFLALADARERWSIDARPDVEVLRATWVDTSGGEASVEATFPLGALSAGERLTFDMVDIRAEVVGRLQAWAREHAPSVEVTLHGKEIGYTARGRDAEEAVGRVQAQRERLYTAILEERRLARLDDVTLQFDAPRIAAESAPALAPLVEGLGATLDARALATRALAFVQSIPYDRGARSDFATPLALLRLHLGDCDEKSTLFLGMLRSAEPSLGLALFTTEGHAWVGLDLPARASETTVDVNGTSWLVAEPVGPAIAPLGRLSAVSAAALERKDFRVFRVP